MSEYKTLINEIHKNVVRKYPTRTVETSYVGDIFALDLMDMSSLKNSNQGVVFLMCCVDVYSRFAYVWPLKSKNAESVAEHFFKSGNIKAFPTNLWVDEGSEFYNSTFKGLCKEADINMYSVSSTRKSSYVERFNRTLRLMITKYMEENDTHKYIDALDTIVDTYNHTVQSRLGVSPSDIVAGKLPRRGVLKIVEGDAKFKVGEYVRVAVVKKIFDKGSKANWTHEVYKIKSINRKESPDMYVLENLMGVEQNGKYYANQLLLTKIPKLLFFNDVVRVSQGKSLVSFQGYGSEFDRWVENDELVKLKKKKYVEL